jgi:hypothetical protein
MPKIYILFFYCIVFTSNAQTSTGASGKLDSIEIDFLKKNYNWNTEDILILNFNQPTKNCHYDNYTDLNGSIKWWKSYYKKINLVGVANRFVYSDNRANNIIDRQTIFMDKDNKLLETFFDKYPYCHGVLVVNQYGAYELKGSEYLEKDIESYLEKLQR